MQLNSKTFFPTHQFVTLRFDWLPLSIYNPIEREHIPSFNQKLKTYCRQQTEAPLFFFFFSWNHVHWRRSALHYSDLPSSARQFGWAPHINFTVTDKTRRHQRTIEVPTRWNGLGSRKCFAVPLSLIEESSSCGEGNRVGLRTTWSEPMVRNASCASL